MFDPPYFPEAPIFFPIIAIVLAAGVSILPATPWVRRARAGVAALWLGFASLVVVTGSLGMSGLTPHLAASLAAANPTGGYLAGTAALVALGLVLVATAVVQSALDQTLSLSGRLVAKVMSVVVVLAIVAVLPLWKLAPPLASLATLAGLAALGWLAPRVISALRLGALVGRADRLLGAPGPDGEPAAGRGTPRENGLLGAGLVLCLIPTATTLMTGILVASAGQYLRARRAKQVGGLPLNVFAALALLPALWLLIVVSGSPFPSLLTLRDAPLSPAAELWIAPWLLVACWSLLGLWPVRWLVPPPWLAALAGLMLITVGAAVPLGLSAFQPWLAPVLVVSAAWGVATRRDELVLGSLALFGVLATPEGSRAWLILPFIGVSLLALRDDLGPRRYGPELAKGASLLALPGLWFGLVAGLGSQVVYTVLCVGIVAGRVADSKGRAESP